MIGDIELKNILFIDIETVPGVYDFNQLDSVWQELWSEKTRFLQERDGMGPDELYSKAGIYAEFGKIVCISTAIFHGEGTDMKLRVKSFYGKEEPTLLTEFAVMLRRFDRGSEKYICGHNVKEFDIPYIARRMLVNRMELPRIIDLAGKKPWEVKHLDTMELWKFGDYKHFTSLKLLTQLFDVPTPKDDISGSDVSKVFWENDGLEQIRIYCEKDTVAVARLLQRFLNTDIVKDEAVEVV